MLSERKIGDGIQMQLMEKWAMNEEINSSLTPVIEHSQATFHNLKNQAEILSESQIQVSKRLDQLEVRHIKIESQDESNQFLVVAVEEQEQLLAKIEEELLSKKQCNDEFAAGIERLKQLNVKLSSLFKSYQLMSRNEDIDELDELWEEIINPSQPFSKVNDALTKIVEKVDACQIEINELETERLRIDNKVVTLRGRYNQHYHSSGYTLGNHSGSAGCSSGPTL